MPDRLRAAHGWLRPLLRSTLYLGLGASFAMPAAAQTPGPAAPARRNVEIVVGVAAGSVLDKVARMIQQTLRDGDLRGASVLVLNKPGAGQSIAMSYVAQRAGDGRTLLVTSPPIVTNTILGQGDIGHNDLTPIAIMTTEPIAFFVRGDSSIKSGAEIVRRLTKDPKLVTFAYATAIGSQNHVALVRVMRAAGIDAAKPLMVVYPSGSASVTAVLTGEVDVVITAPSNAAGQVDAGRMRMVAVAADRRIGGRFAQVPTWKEQGVNVSAATWRAVFGPSRMEPAQITVWENALKTVTQSELWLRDVEANFLDNVFLQGASARSFLDQEYEAYRSVLTALGLAKR